MLRFDKYLKILNPLKETKPDEKMFHYTTWNGLKGILETQQLWLTHYKNLNDTSEINHAIESIEKNLTADESDDHFRLYLSDLFSDFRAENSNIYDFYIGCFCVKKNHLSTWRLYSADAAGYSIGFNKEFFKTTDNPDINNHIYGTTKIFYDYRKIKGFIDELFSMVKADLIDEQAFENNNKEIRKDISKEFLATLYPLLAAIKHNAFEDEHEYRIYKLTPPEDNSQSFYTSNNNILSPHLHSKKTASFKFELKHISEIWVGPRLNFEHAKIDIQNTFDILNKSGHKTDHIQIIPSEIPYKKL